MAGGLVAAPAAVGVVAATLVVLATGAPLPQCPVGLCRMDDECRSCSKASAGDGDDSIGGQSAPRFLLSGIQAEVASLPSPPATPSAAVGDGQHCPDRQYRVDNIVWQCGSTKNAGLFHVQSGTSKVAVQVPKDVWNFGFKATSGDAFMVQVVDESDGKIVLHGSGGQGAVAQSTEIQGSTITFTSAPEGSGTVSNVWIEGQTKDKLTVKLAGIVPGATVDVHMEYIYEKIEPCPQTLSGCSAFEPAMAENAVRHWSCGIQLRKHAGANKSDIADRAWNENVVPAIQGLPDRSHIPWYRFHSVWWRADVVPDAEDWQVAFQYLDQDGDALVSRAEFDAAVDICAEVAAHGPPHPGIEPLGVFMAGVVVLLPLGIFLALYMSGTSKNRPTHVPLDRDEMDEEKAFAHAPPPPPEPACEPVKPSRSSYSPLPIERAAYVNSGGVMPMHDNRACAAGGWDDIMTCIGWRGGGGGGNAANTWACGCCKHRMLAQMTTCSHCGFARPTTQAIPRPQLRLTPRPSPRPAPPPAQRPESAPAHVPEPMPAHEPAHVPLEQEDLRQGYIPPVDRRPEAVQEALADAGVAEHKTGDPIVNALEGLRMHEGASIQKLQGHCRCLQEHANEIDGRECILSHDWENALFPAMKANIHNSEFQMQGCKLIRSLIQGKEEIADTVVRHNGVETVLGALRVGLSNDELAEWSCWALQHLSLSPEGRNQIHSRRGVSMIIEGMTAHPGRPGVQEAGCNAVGNLFFEEEHRTELVHSDQGVDLCRAICSAMLHPRHAWDEGIVSAGISVLHNLACEAELLDPLCRAGAIQALTQAKQNHTNLSADEIEDVDATLECLRQWQEEEDGDVDVNRS